MYESATRRRLSAAHGFTLVEMLIVTIIFGILAGVVMASIRSPVQDASNSAFVTVLRTFVNAADVHRARTGDHIDDAASGQLPAALTGLIDANQWQNGTPLGGVWDSEYNDNGIVSALGVHFNGTGVTRDDAYMTLIDRLCDDGDLNTGTFQKLNAGRYYWIIAR